HTYMSDLLCNTCCGTRLKKEALAVRLHTLDKHTGTADCSNVDLEHEKDAYGMSGTGDSPMSSKSNGNGNGKHGRVARATIKLPGYSIDDVSRMNIFDAKKFFENLRLGSEGQKIAEPIIREIGNRLGFMIDVGLGYLTLDRKTGTLSGGEAQRIRLATQVGSGLVGVCYVLDEPTIGLHQRDNTRLIRTLRRLRDIGNTVIMVEHDEDCIRHADY